MNKCSFCSFIKEKLTWYSDVIESEYKDFPFKKLEKFISVAYIRKEYTLQKCPYCISFILYYDGSEFCTHNFEYYHVRSWEPLSLEEVHTLLYDSLDNPEFSLYDKSLIPLYNFGLLKKSYHKHTKFVGSIVGLPNNRFISSSEDGRMIIWNYENSYYIEIHGHEAPVNYMYLTNDKRYLLSASDDCTIKIWDTHTWQLVQTFTGHKDYVVKACAVKSESVVSVSRDKTVRVWDFNTGKCKYILKGHQARINCLAISPDGKKAITASINNTTIVWDIETGKKIITLVNEDKDVKFLKNLPEDIYIEKKNYSGIGHKGSPKFALWLNNGMIITASEDIIIWDDQSFKEIKRLEGHPWKINYLAVCNKNKYLISVAHCIKIWDLENGKEITSLPGHNGVQIYSAAISINEDFLITGDKSGKINIWNLNSILSEQRITGHMGCSNSISLYQYKYLTTTGDKDKFAATGGNDKTVIIWDSYTRKPLHYLRGHFDMFTQVIGFRHNGKQLLTTCSGHLYIWNTENGQLIKTIAHNKKTYDMEVWSFINDNTYIFSGTKNDKPVLWDLENGSTKTYDVEFGFTHSLIASKNNQYILACTYPKFLHDKKDKDRKEPDISPVILWDIQKERIAREFLMPEKRNTTDKDKDKRYYPLKAIFNYNEDKIIAGFSDGTICIWDIDSKKLLKIKNISKHSITALFLIDNTSILTICANDKSIELWDYNTFNLIKKIKISCTQLCYPKVSLNNTLLAVASHKKKVTIINLKTGNKISTRKTFNEISDLNLSDNKVYITTKTGLLHIRPVHD